MAKFDPEKHEIIRQGNVANIRCKTCNKYYDRCICGPITKEQAIHEMGQGKRVRHRHFSDYEWMKQVGHLYEFEDGVLVEPEDFWKIRTALSWETGWEIVKEAPPS